MDNLQDKIERLKKAVSDGHSMPAPMMDMNQDMNPNVCPDGSVPGPMGCPPKPKPPEPPKTGCCVYQIGNQQIPQGVMTAEECAQIGGIYLGNGSECPKEAIKNLLRLLERSIPSSEQDQVSSI